ncbi:AI-2E family transporter [Methylocaldum sp.]|uniref:AI-2E family transporter n=1 Tax=Methylocaldum sp. TaxID=1969727 RepID=UPI002D3586DD|nr:AI-2E family transporter [Methylocaldum sp.]HYE37755.1 AI-2E family transporter [Methylocaldum sp.]
MENSRRDGDEGWLTRERMLAMILILITGLAFYLCYRLVYPFLPALAWALALAIITYPLHRTIKRYLPSESVAAGAAVVIVALIIVAPSMLLAQRIALEATQNIELVKTEAAINRWQAVIERNRRIAPVAGWIDKHFNPRQETVRFVEQIRSHIPGFVTGSIGVGIQLLITFFALFYFFRDRYAFLHLLRSLSPLSHAETERVFARVVDTVQATVFGTLLVAIVQGFLGGIMFWWLGLSGPVLWGVVMGLLAIIPILGPFVVWVPAAIMLAIDGDWGKALILTIWGGVVVALIDNLLYPIFVGGKLRLHTFPVFMAIIGGLALFGASGLILGPVVLAVTVALIDIWRYRTAAGRKADTDAAA